MRFRLGYNRTHGAARLLEQRAAGAKSAAILAEAKGLVPYAASLRGKAAAYTEAAEIVAALDRDRRLPRRMWDRDTPADDGGAA